jgi:outer membrane protein assembly factor BamE (lipoprotein component of BamABCDE complex)
MTFTLSKKTVLILVLLCLIVLGGGTVVYVRYFFLQDMFREGPTKKVNLAGWQKLEVGMTKQQVISLLGDAASKRGPETTTMSDRVTYDPEYWEYNWTSGIPILAHPHPKSYSVYFDKEGRLAGWREPEPTHEHNK